MRSVTGPIPGSAAAQTSRNGQHSAFWPTHRLKVATEVFLVDPNRFATGNQVASYIGIIPCEHSSGKRQRLGKLSKEGNSLLRYLWTEATMHAVGKDPDPNNRHITRVAALSGLFWGWGPGLNVSNEGHTVLYGKGDGEAADIMLIEGFR